MDEADALAAAARRRLNHDGVADLLGQPRRLAHVVQPGVVPGDDGYARIARDPSGCGLLAHLAHDAPRRPNEAKTRAGAGVGEFRILREKTIARVDRARVCLARRVENLGDAQIALGGGGWPNVDRHIRHAHMGRRAVGVAIDCDRFQPQIAAGADDAQSNLAAIGDENGIERETLARLA